jgi:hypothetical protein
VSRRRRGVLRGCLDHHRRCAGSSIRCTIRMLDHPAIGMCTDVAATFEDQIAKRCPQSGSVADPFAAVVVTQARIVKRSGSEAHLIQLARSAVDSACQRPDETAIERPPVPSFVRSATCRIVGSATRRCRLRKPPGDHAGIAHSDVGKPAMRGVVAIKMRCASFMAIASHSCRHYLINPYTAVSAVRRILTCGITRRVRG